MSGRCQHLLSQDIACPSVWKHAMHFPFPSCDKNALHLQHQFCCMENPRHSVGGRESLIFLLQASLEQMPLDRVGHPQAVHPSLCLLPRVVGLSSGPAKGEAVWEVRGCLDEGWSGNMSRAWCASHLFLSCKYVHAPVTAGGHHQGWLPWYCLDCSCPPTLSPGRTGLLSGDWKLLFLPQTCSLSRTSYTE